MHITLEADYAVRIVEQLARSPERQDAKTISAKTGVPLRFCLKILRTLVSQKIARSYKGAHGGYLLAKAPEEITLRSVIEAIEGPYQFCRCVGGEFFCTRGDDCACPFHDVYKEITGLVREKLEQVTFSLAAQPQQSETGDTNKA